MAKRKPRSQKTLEPQQERSRESLQKLLRAATEVLGQHGVDGATIPRIAHHAGLTPGSVYRRFHDKEALLETAILGLLERQEALNRTMTPEMVKEIPLRVFSEQVINGIVMGYRLRASLIRAMRQFTTSRHDTPFWKKVSRVEIRNFEQLVDKFMLHQDRICHPEPRTAIATGLMLVIGSVVELIVVNRDLSMWKGLIPSDDQSLKRELLRAFLNYLGVENAPGAAGKMEEQSMAAMSRWRARSSQNV